MIDFDFENDIKLEIAAISKEMGFKINLNQKFYEILLDYLTVRLKIVEPKHRQIFINPDFLIELINHPKKREIETIIDFAKNGKGLNVFQSRRLFQSNFHDHLQQEWNIYHFHLSLEKDHKSVFVKQVNSLLFAYIDDTHIVFLGTDTHKNGIFGDIKWIEILHDKFPKIIEKYKDDKILDIHPNLTSIERQTVWEKGLTVGMTKVKGVVYHNPGVGQMLSRHSMTVSKTAMEISRWIYRLKEQINQNRKEISDYLGISMDLGEFKIRFGDSKLELIELTSRTILLEFPEILIEKEELIKKTLATTQAHTP